ncbi:uncharacterized protein PAC_03850 [Phialocephala subalpina]|uniref:Uncharacterized protein n=1 Tax=Phialocephala subalpina TaxID=576137 RepID=A0A1L7WMH7_9HELO|nr:uncharacterized protein PAC_03850 [Phialocephala subalpina]
MQLWAEERYRCGNVLSGGMKDRWTVGTILEVSLCTEHQTIYSWPRSELSPNHQRPPVQASPRTGGLGSLLNISKMSAKTKPKHSSTRHSLDDIMSAFNKQLIEEASKSSASKDRISRVPWRGDRGRRTPKPHIRSASTSAISHHDSHRESTQQHKRRSMGAQQTSTNKIRTTYTRPVGPELVSSKHPSCIGLPPTWDEDHDRFIAYCATHAPLDKGGRVPRGEERRERWATGDIVRELGVRFPRLGEGGKIKPSMIEKRLTLLDQAGDNDYFKRSYGAYTYEEWGRGI